MSLLILIKSFKYYQTLLFFFVKIIYYHGGKHYTSPCDVSVDNRTLESYKREYFQLNFDSNTQYF